MATPVDPKHSVTVANPPADGGVAPPPDRETPPVANPPLDKFRNDPDNYGRILAGEPPDPDPRAQNNVKVTPHYDGDTMSAQGTKVVGTFPAGRIDVAKLTEVLSGNDDAGLKTLMGPTAKAGGGRSTYLTGTDKVSFRVNLTASVQGRGTNKVTITLTATGEVDPKNPTYTTNNSTYTLETASDGSLTVTLTLGEQKLKMDHLPEERQREIRRLVKDAEDDIPGQLRINFKKTFNKFPKVAPK